MTLNQGMLNMISKHVGLPKVTHKMNQRRLTLNKIPKQITNVTVSEESKEYERLFGQKKLTDLKHEFDYCPDEDSDNDIWTIRVNCPPGIKVPEAKPNDPKVLHTWR